MSKSPSYKSQSRLRGLWCALSGWLIVGLVLIIGLSACAPQPEQSRPATASTSAPPTATTAQQLVPTPVIVSTSTAPVITTPPPAASPTVTPAQQIAPTAAIFSTATNPLGRETKLGFNVRGWT
jgi:hypothetical protein